jgi:DNA-binding GntR family transcriptional regulator
MPVPTESLPARPLLRDDVYARLRDAIVDGTLAPDEQLRDTELASWLGVSRTPVREALLELSRAGLVRAIPGRSTVVAPLDVMSIREAQAVVAAMHALAVRDAAGRLREGDIERMRAANAAFAEAQQRGDVDAALRADEDFHAVAIDASGNRAVRSVLGQYEPVLRRAERLRFASSEGEESIARHERLTELLALGDAEGASRVAEQTWQTLTIDTLAIDTPNSDEGRPA